MRIPNTPKANLHGRKFASENDARSKMLNTLAQMFRILHSIQSQRKCIFILFVVLLILLVCCNNVVIGKCIGDSTCMNGGVCINGTCVCPDGWQGNDCEFCGGKVR